jgi:hypothetical protein
MINLFNFNAKIWQILAILSPIQVSLVIFLNQKLGFPASLSLWKECLILILIISMCYQLIAKNTFSYLKKPEILFLLAFVILNILTLLSSFVWNKVELKQFLIGYRFEVFWLWLMIIGHFWVKYIPDRIQLQNLFGKITSGIMFGLGACLILSTAALVFGSDYLQLIGYQKITTNVSTDSVSAPICHVIDFGINQCRLASPFASPNHLSSYLLLILSFLIFNLSQTWQNRGNWLQQIMLNSQNPRTRSYLGLSCIVIFCILQTYSRFALLGLILILGGFGIWQLRKKLIWLDKIYTQFTIGFILLISCFAILVTTFDPSISSRILPPFLSKPSSSIEHYRLTQVNLDILKQKPSILLQGLGQASSGPAANYTPDPELVKDFGQLTYKWFIPENRIVVPENWYLQLVLNGGLIYTLLYLLIVSLPIWNLYSSIHNKSNYLILALGFMSIILGNFFLHLWENQTVVIYWSILHIWLITQRKLVS